MESTKKRSKRRCPVCHTTKLRRSEDAGLVCKYGHKILGIQKEEDDEEAYHYHRTVRKRKRKIFDQEFITASVKRSALIRIIQHALKIVCRQMVQELGFPADLEYTVRELWLVAVSALNIELDNSYIFEMKEKERNEKKQGTIPTQVNPEELLSEQDDTDEEEDDEFIQETDQQQDDNKSKSSTHTINLRYSDVLTIVYLACIYLRLAILPSDIVRWCKNDMIHYTTIQRKIPEDLLRCVSLFTANSMVSIPSTNDIHRRAMELAKYLYFPQGLVMPDYNIPLYLDRFCSQFYLPVEGYYISLYLFKKYQLPCDLSITTEGQKKRMGVLKKVMACVVCVIKLFYSLDHSKNFQNESSVYDINTTREKWVELIKENMKSWEKSLEVSPENNTTFAMRLVQDSTKSHDIGTPLKVKTALFRKFLDQTTNVSKSISNTQPNINPFINPPDRDTIKAQADVQPEGRFFYMYKFGLRPCDYELVLKFACLVVGERSMVGLEHLIMWLDKRIDKTMATKKLDEVVLSERYPLYPVALKNLYGTKFYHNHLECE